MKIWKIHLIQVKNKARDIFLSIFVTNINSFRLYKVRPRRQVVCSQMRKLRKQRGNQIEVKWSTLVAPWHMIQPQVIQSTLCCHLIKWLNALWIKCHTGLISNETFIKKQIILLDEMSWSSNDWITCRRIKCGPWF